MSGQISRLLGHKCNLGHNKRFSCHNPSKWHDFTHNQTTNWYQPTYWEVWQQKQCISFSCSIAGNCPVGPFNSTKPLSTHLILLHIHVNPNFIQFWWDLSCQYVSKADNTPSDDKFVYNECHWPLAGLRRQMKGPRWGRKLYPQSQTQQLPRINAWEVQQRCIYWQLLLFVMENINYT